MLQLRFGAMAAPIATQLKQQDFLFDKNEIKILQKDVEAVIRLKLRHLLSQSQVDKCFAKIGKKIESHVATFTKQVEKKLQKIKQ